MAVSLPRDEDMEMVPAWLELETVPTSAPAVWSTVAAKLTDADPHVLIERARLLGAPGRPRRRGDPIPRTRPGARGTTRRRTDHDPT